AGAPLTEAARARADVVSAVSIPIDLADVRGQPHAKRALEVAAAGAHHLLLVGPPGAGKTLLARALPGILPALTHPEAVEVTSIASVSACCRRAPACSMSHPCGHPITPSRPPPWWAVEAPRPGPARSPGRIEACCF